MKEKKLFKEIEEHIDAVITQSTPQGVSLFESLLLIHPADVADLLGMISQERAKQLFILLPEKLKVASFAELSDGMKICVLGAVSDQEKAEVLESLPIDQLTDLFDSLSDEELKLYLGLLHKNSREKVLSLRKFDPDSAGGIMDTEVLVLMKDYTVEKSIKLLQRLGPSREIHRNIFVTDYGHKLVGYINLEDLVLQKPQERLVSFMHKNELIVRTNEDQEAVACKMVHYGLMIVPVVDDSNHFLGIISSDTLVDVLVEEASENVQKMASAPPLRYPYFEAPFSQLFCRRAYVLLALFVAEMLSGNILRAYHKLGVMTMILSSFVPVITSAGGNIGSQSSAIVIQGLASGEFDFSNMFRLLRREFLVAVASSVLLGFISFVRVWSIQGSYAECFAVSCALALILFCSAMFGTTIPFLLRRLHIDPAISAGPFLATIMDILGIFIFCHMSKLILG